MNEKVSKLLLAGDKFMPELHLKQPEFIYSDCGPFTKNRKRIQKFKETEKQIIFRKMNKIKLVFNMIWLRGIFKDLARRISKHEIRLLRDKAFKIAKKIKNKIK